MTPGQREVLNALGSFLAENGYSPSISDLMVRLDTRSRNRIQTSLLALREEGLVTWSSGRGRTLRITGSEAEVPDNGQKV
jgi:SOS-response transcriptional repressor LexA